MATEVIPVLEAEVALNLPSIKMRMDSVERANAFGRYPGFVAWIVCGQEGNNKAGDRGG